MDNRHLYFKGTLIILLFTLITFFGLNLLPISYSFRLLEVFGIVMLFLLSILGIKPNIVNEN